MPTSASPTQESHRPCAQSYLHSSSRPRRTMARSPPSSCGDPQGFRALTAEVVVIVGPDFPTTPTIWLPRVRFGASKGFHSPAVTAQHYLGFTRRCYEEIREALRFGLSTPDASIGSEALVRLADLIEVGAAVGAPSAAATERARPRGKNTKVIQPLPKRAMRDSNPRPLAPEANALSS